MGLIIAVIFFKIGSKRVIGGFDSFFWCLLCPPLGIYFVLKSRRLNDDIKAKLLMEKMSCRAHNLHTP